MVTAVQAPRIPHLVHIETTYACNQSCIFCYNPRRDSIVDQDRVDRIVQAVYDSWVPHVYLIGGEPSMLRVRKLNQYIDLLSQRSSVTIVTNGQIYLDGLSTKLACIGVPIHGMEETHDFLADKSGSFRQAFRSVSKYVKRGFDVRCIPVLTSFNYNQMFDVIGLAHQFGMESVFVDRYEDGGLGSRSGVDLKPSNLQFRIALGQMIEGREAFKIPVGWGTAIPFCLDSRLLTENMGADCGAGVTFAAIDPFGSVRACNQSERVYGNVLEEDLETIWTKPELDDFRGLSWVEKPCTSCSVLSSCLAGCKVDANSGGIYSVDYSVRGHEFPLQLVIPPEEIAVEEEIGPYRNFHVNSYTKINSAHRPTYLVTRYQTVELDRAAEDLIGQIIAGVGGEEELISRNQTWVDPSEIRKLVSTLIKAGAIDPDV